MYPLTLARIDISPLSIPLIEPFVIATGRIDCTRAALVTVQLRDAHGRVAIGLGEAAALPPVTREDQPEILAKLGQVAQALAGQSLDGLAALTPLLDSVLGEHPVSRAGLECAVLDAMARLADKPLCTFLSGAPPARLVTDMTLPIGDPQHMAALAAAHRAAGFSVFKVKVGRQLADDIEALRLVKARVPDARFRLDANEGYGAPEAFAMLDAAHEANLPIECFEQPCARSDVQGMVVVTADGRAQVIADESVRTLADLEALHAVGGCHGVNLKLVKSGGLLAALAIGKRARELGLSVMCGGMVESRLGMTAMAHVACALFGVDYVDLDTAFLLAEDPFSGGYLNQGPELTLSNAAGLGIRHHDA